MGAAALVDASAPGGPGHTQTGPCPAPACGEADGQGRTLEPMLQEGPEHSPRVWRGVQGQGTGSGGQDGGRHVWGEAKDRMLEKHQDCFANIVGCCMGRDGGGGFGERVRSWPQGRWLVQSGDLGRLPAALPGVGKPEEVPVPRLPLLLPVPTPEAIPRPQPPPPPIASLASVP